MKHQTTRNSGVSFPCSMLRHLAILLGLLGAFPTDVAAQEELYELGRRLRRFEIAWQSADATNRAASARPMQLAVSSFFSAQIKNTARQLDNAYFTVLGKKPTPFELHAVPYSCRIIPTAQEANRSRFQLIVKTFYQPAAESNNSKLNWTLTDSKTGKEVAAGSQTLVNLQQPWTWRLKNRLPSGEYLLASKITSSAGEFALNPSTVSIVDNFEKRLVKMETTINGLRGKIDNSLFYSVRMNVEILRKQLSGEILETDYPATRLIELAEAVVASPEKGWKILNERAAESDVWLTLAQQRKRVPLRVRAPKTKSKLPVLFLFHGAGGSENMFFESCGAGRCVELGMERDWLVVAPRQQLRGLSLNCAQLLDELEKLFDIDRKQVFVIGHSMGGAQVVTQASANPDLITAAAVIGGGGRARDYRLLSKIPWFVAAGKLDFGRPGAATLARQLESSGADVKYIEKEDVEHMVIVQAVTDEVFQFFDDAVANPKQRTAKSPKPQPQLEFRIAEDKPSEGLIESKLADSDDSVYLHRRPVCTELDVEVARSEVDEYGRLAIRIRFNENGAKRMGEATAKHKQKRLAIVFNDKVLSAPIIQTEFSQEAWLTGSFTAEEIQQILNLFR